MTMNLAKYMTALAMSTAFMTVANAETFTSKARATDVLELYTSEGCNSCPPADRWFTSLKQHPKVFKDFIPLAFHVDYWNYLGWEDRFSKADYSYRQRQHVASGNARQGYTPQVILNNKEWQGHLRGITTWDAGRKKVGVLSVDVQENQSLIINFTPHSTLSFQQKDWVINVAYLGMGFVTSVKRGENAGRALQHDFVVLTQQTYPVDSAKMTWQINAPLRPDVGQQQTALVVWLSEPDTQRTLQAVGGYL